MGPEQQFDGIDVLLVDGVQQGVAEFHARTDQQLHHLNNDNDSDNDDNDDNNDNDNNKRIWYEP